MGFDATTLEGLAEAVRAAAAARTWSRGVVLAREGAVEGLEESEDEVVLAVRTKERPVPASVVVYPLDEEWDCDCGGKLDVCPHVAAAVIALTQARKEDEGALPESARPRATVRYALTRAGGLLALERLELRPDGATRRIGEPVQQAAQSARGGVELALQEVDLALERFLQGGRTVIDRREQAKLLFARLAEAKDVTLDGDPVTVETELALPRGRVQRAGAGFRFTIEKDPEVDEVVAPDVARLGRRLRLIGESALSGERLQKLPVERRFGPAEQAVLQQEVLPMFEGRFPIDVEIELERAKGKGRPRVELDVHLSERSVSVTGWIVYGDPAVVRIEDGRPVSLRSGAAPGRDFEAEHRLVDRLRSELNLIPGRTTTVVGAEGAAFLQKVRAFEATAGRGFDEADVPVLEPKLEIEEDGRFHLDFEADGEDEGGRADPAAALAAFEAGHALVPLAGGGWGRLSQAWWEAHADEVALLLHLRDREGRVPPFGLPALGALSAALDEPPPPGLERLAPLFEGFEALPPAALPSDLQASLRSYQRAGVDWLAFAKSIGLGALLADDMGLGKTLQTICVLAPRSLVVCPTSVLDNWRQEIRRFRPSLRVHVHHGPNRKMDPEADVVITSYALLRGDRDLLEAERWAVAVLDEAQAIKNPESLTARAAFALSADFKLALTGTPVENRLTELWSQMHFTNPGLLGGKADFEARFAKPIEAGDAEAQAKLRARTKPVVLRRLKRDVAQDLPPRTDMVLHVELDETERAAYDGVRLATQKEVAALLDAGGSVMQALEALLRLRQAACHPGLLPGRAAEGSSKLDLLLETLEEAVSEGHKALVFSQWTSLLDLLEPQLSRAKLPFTRLDGATPDRGRVVAEFQDAAGPPVMILSLKAGGTGLNLTAADHVFLLDPWWNPAAEDQAADRAHRIGQDRPVMVHRLVAKGTVEERILALQEKKRSLAEAAVGEGGVAAGLTREDLLGLLS
jgi:superfamily II DNA or RNA helicase